VIRAVLDANVLVSGLLRRHPDAPSVQILDAWQRGDFELIVSREIIAEVERAFSKPYFRARLSDEQIARALRLLRRRPRLVRITSQVQGIVSDPDDDIVLAAALSGSANYLVSGDQALIELGSYKEVEIKTPRDFLDILQTPTQS
jgi:putative PIN family toxin of toxin-antitoxin system